MLNPRDKFSYYARNLGDKVKDNPAYRRPLYPDFDDYDYMHDTSKQVPIYLNDFDINLEDDRERLSEITRMDFTGNTFETIASCTCGKLRGNFLVGSNRVCKNCGDKVEKFLNKGSDTRVWIKLPEGVKGFVNLGFYSTFMTSINVAQNCPKINLPRYFMDSSYRKAQTGVKKYSKALVHHIASELNITEINLNSFYDNYDRIMEYLLIGPGRTYLLSSIKKDSDKLWQVYKKYRHLTFCNYIKVPNRYNAIIERSGKESYSAKGQLETTQLYYALADTLKSDEYHDLGPKDHLRNADIVGKVTIALADQYTRSKGNNHTYIFHKTALSRKHVAAGPVPLTGRTVITSLTGVIDPTALPIPWNMALGILEIHITSHLYRQGMVPWAAMEYIDLSSTERLPIIERFFDRMEADRKAIIEAGRNPSIEYLSLRSFFMMVNRNLEDESIKLPITTVGAYNADFDGDNLYVLLAPDNQSKARCYGSFGHHQMLDPNTPFKIGRYAGQTATNLMNINTLMQQMPLED